MKLLTTIALLLISASSFAKLDCSASAVEAFSKQYPRFQIGNVKEAGSIAPGASEMFYMGDVWNDTDKTLDIYGVRSFFMATFTHAVLVDGNCKVESIIEVGFE